MTEVWPYLLTTAWLTEEGQVSRWALTPAARPTPPQRLDATHQVLELHIQVLLDGEASVGDGFAEVCVQVRQHLEGQDAVDA